MLMPAAPAPTMHRSASSTLPFGRVRASMCMAGCRRGSVREKGEESALARFGYRDHPSLQHHRPSGLVEQDFAIGRTMVLQGWVVSVTEARQSALFSLLSD